MNATDSPTESSTYFPEQKIEGAIERRLEQIPGQGFLWAAFGSIGLSMTLRLLGRRHDALFVGQWAPTFLLLGLHRRMIRARLERLAHNETI